MVRVFFGEPEICDDCAAVLHKDVGQLEITMQESFFSHFDKALNDVFEDLERISF